MKTKLGSDKTQKSTHQSLTKPFGKKFMSFVLCICMLTAMLSAMPSAVYAETTINRAEWISSLVTAFSMSVDDESTMPDNYFSDITTDTPYYHDILLAVEFGVIDLGAGEAFEPEKPATREFAAHTLNFCLKFQLEEKQYTYNESSDVSYPDDIQVAINRGWFNLSDNNFMPQQGITKAESDVMLGDAKTIVSGQAINSEYESKYEFGEGVKVIPETVNTSIATDYTVTITDYECNINAGDIFVVYSAGIPVALKAISIEKNENVTTVSATADGTENVVTSVDSEGVAEFDLENFETNDVETYSITDIETHETSEMQISLQSINYDKKAKKLTATKVIKVSGTSNAGSITVEVSDLKLYHKENTKSGDYMAYIQGNTSVTKSISFDIGNYVGIPSSITLGYINVGGIGNVSLNIDISIKGGMSSNETGVITTGFSYARNDGFRLINGYKKTAYSFTAEAEVKVGLTLSANIDLVVMSGRIWATVGVKGYFKFKDYTYVDGERPLQCKTIGGFLYANVGASASINYFIDKKSWSKTVDIYTESNSPIRVYYHYEDNQLVDCCTRGKDNNEAYIKYTTHTNSAYFNPSPSYGQGSYTGGDGTTTTLWTYTTDSEGNATITGYKGSASSLAIPSTIDGYTVTGIGYRAFENNKNIRSVAISDSVTKIDAGAFSNCTNLKSVKLSKNLSFLGDIAFHNCKQLNNIEIPASLKRVSNEGYSDSGAFSGCTALENVTFEDGITMIPQYLFKNCPGIKQINIPDTVVEIKYRAFEKCINLSLVDIPDNMTTIGDHVFENCTALKEIDIPDSVTGMGEYIFSGCTSLEKVKLPNAIQNIMAGTFYNCKKLKDIVLPETVTAIRQNAFYGCASLPSINLPDGLQTIEDNAFYECKALTDITIPKNVTSIGSKVFYNCDGLQKAVINASGTVGSQAFYDCDALTSLTLSDGITQIGSSLCYGCDALTDIKFGKYITEIPDSAFRKCAALQSVTLPRFCKTVAANAFAEDTKLTEAYVPVSVSSIQSNSFSYPKKMTMYGKDGSYAQEYASNRKMTFSAVNAPISGFSFADNTLMVDRYKTFTEPLNISPDFDTDTITFTSSNTNVATVSENGEIYTRSYGSAKISAKANDGNKTATLNLTVAAPVHAETIKLDKNNISLRLGTTAKLNATVTPSNTSDTVRWATSDRNIVTVENGNLTPVAMGTATITAITSNGLTDRCTVTVLTDSVISKLSAKRNGTTLTASLESVKVENGAKAVFAAYTSKNVLCGMTEVFVSDNAATAEFKAENAAYVKAFIWKANGMIPIVTPERVTVQ
ncbi:MAG: leucine-rich repeat protein [Clostridiales bacterium]|nr:leucine-rich repeat protein [Clostridiales bacterium]